MDLTRELQRSCRVGSDCQKEGTLWSVIFMLNGILMLLIVVKQLFVCVGVYVAACRMIAGCWAIYLWCPYFAALIVTPVFRFSDKSKLCALNPTPTNYDSWDARPQSDDTWTYEKDGALILALWILQLICCCCPCYGGQACDKRQFASL